MPAVRVIVALTLSSMFPIFRHFSAKMAIRQPMTPNTMPTIIRARTAWSRAGSQSNNIQSISQHVGSKKSTSLYPDRGVKMSALSTSCTIKHFLYNNNSNPLYKISQHFQTISDISLTSTECGQKVLQPLKLFWSFTAKQSCSSLPNSRSRRRLVLNV